ncbi:MAG: VanZ family protein [Chloroflexi bacterium]|nr:VanZ family protein [Chloroflexota bacterium]
MTRESPFARIGFTRLAFYWIPAVVWAVSIFVVSNIPAQEIQKAAETVDVVDSVPIPLDIAYHVVVFGVMGALGYRVVSLYLRQARLSYLAALAFAIGYGVTDELHQSFVSGRSSSAEDVGYDALGAAIGLAAVFAISVIFSRARRNLMED